MDPCDDPASVCYTKQFVKGVPVECEDPFPGCDVKDSVFTLCNIINIFWPACLPVEMAEWHLLRF